MVLLTDGLNRIRDLINTDIYKCEAGTGVSSPTEDDTALETPVVATLGTPTKTTADKSIQLTHIIAAGIATGSILSEQEVQLNSGTDHFNRIVHTALIKSNLDQYEYITIFFIKSG
jgi:hypothetical protein